MLQILADGLIIGSVVALGAIGLSMTLSIVRFSNFSHGELLGWGAYLALMASTALSTTSLALTAPIAPFSFGLGLLASLLLACLLTALLALGLDTLLFKRLRKAGSITLVIASFGAALALRKRGLRALAPRARAGAQARRRVRGVQKEGRVEQRAALGRGGAAEEGALPRDALELER